MLKPGYSSNYGARKKAKYVYLTATLDAATWGAELAVGDGCGRIYRVEPTEWNIKFKGIRTALRAGGIFYEEGDLSCGRLLLGNRSIS